MRVLQSKPDLRARLDSLTPGQTYRFGAAVYVVTNQKNSTPKVTVVRLEDGSIDTLCPATIVSPIECEVRVLSQ